MAERLSSLRRQDPVPFKRGGADAAVHDAAPAAAVVVEDRRRPIRGHARVTVADTRVERGAGEIRATLKQDLDGDKQPDVVLITSDDAGLAQLEVVPHGATEASARSLLSAKPSPTAATCSRPDCAPSGRSSAGQRGLHV